MKIFKKAGIQAATFVGEQEVKENIHYRPFTYVSLTEVDGVCVACNRLTRCLAVITPTEEQILKDGIDGALGAEELIKNWFLVPDDHDDYQFCSDTRELFKVFKKTAKKNTYTIMTTLDCNARCFYCYQMGRNKTRAAMTEETAKAVANYIIKSAAGKSVDVQWYGGEPLYNPGVIDIICTMLKEAGVDYKSTMISNGYLLSGDLIEKAVTLWKLEKVQIALDGTEEVYNRVKAYIYKDGANPYSVVMSNIKQALDKGIRILVRINMDNHNSEDIYNLADELAANFSGYKNFAVYCDILYEDAGTKKPHRAAEERLELVNSFIRFEYYCIEKGICVPRKLKSEMSINRCMADSDCAVAISPLGEVGPCDHALESQVFRTVFSDDIDNSIIDSWKKVFNNPDTCRNCSNFPDCVRLINCPDDGPMLCDDAYKMKKLHWHKLSVICEYRRIMEENMKKDKEK